MYLWTRVIVYLCICICIHAYVCTCAQVYTSTCVQYKKLVLQASQTSESSGSDDECFLNIKSKKLALMRKHKASLSQGLGCSHQSHNKCELSLTGLSFVDYPSTGL